MNPSDLAALRELPRILAAAGYHDALGRAVPTLAAEVDASGLAPGLAPLVELFYLRRPVARARLAQVLPDQIREALSTLGVLVVRGDAVSTMELVALPAFGHLVFIPSPARAPRAFFGDDTAMLIARMLPVSGTHAVLGAGPGILAIHAAATARRVVAVEPEPIISACAELNLAMSSTDAELRVGPIDGALDETFERVTVAAPTTPLPAGDATADRTGPAVLSRILERLGSVLADDGLAQLSGVWHGDDRGPYLPEAVELAASRARLRIAVTIAAARPLQPGSPLFEAVVERLSAARLSVDPQEPRRASQRFLTERAITALYSTWITVTRASVGEVQISRSASRSW